jgi:hypothetical protein
MVLLDGNSVPGCGPGTGLPLNTYTRTVFQCMLERTDAIANEVLEPIKFVLAYPTAHKENVRTKHLSYIDFLSYEVRLRYRASDQKSLNKFFPFLYWFLDWWFLRLKVEICCTMRWIYRMIKKSLCTWWLQYRKLQVMFKLSPASLQTFIDTPNRVIEDRVQYSTARIPNVSW